MAAIGGGGFAYLSLRSPNLLPPESIQVRMTPENIARGEYLFTVLADCDGCHSERDLSKFSAPVIARGRGRGWQFPKEIGLPGDVVARNITPDVETGIGTWTDGEKISGSFASMPGRLAPRRSRIRHRSRSGRYASTSPPPRLV